MRLLEPAQDPKAHMNDPKPLKQADHDCHDSQIPPRGKTTAAVP